MGSSTGCSCWRSAARATLKLTPESRKSEMRQLISRMLGPTALEAPDSDEPDETDTATVAAQPMPTLDPGEFKLGKGLRLLEGGDSSASGKPTLGDIKTPGTRKGAPLLLSGDQTKLQLRDSNSKLELKP